MASPLGLTGVINIKSYGANPNTYNSIINDSKFYYRPKGNADRIATSSTSVHRPSDNDDIYDTTPNSIIRYTEKDGHQAMTLKSSDFAYLRDIGVYPNNRLIIARRFAVPVSNDLTSIEHRPIATVIGWVKEDDKSFGIEDLTFNEEWTEGEASLTKILSDMFGEKELGKGVGGGLGSIGKNIGNAVPLPGLTRGFQYKLLEKMGVRDSSDSLPDGNPNYVQESSMRKVVDSESNGSALSSKWKVQLTTVYEQKFISGNDPGIVFLDILGNLLRFGTSKSEFFINGTGGALFKDFFKKFEQGKWVAAMQVIIGVVSSAIKEMAAEIKKQIANIAGGDSGEEDTSEEGDKIAGGFTEFANKLAGTLGESIIAKYKVRIASVISAWTGSASAPWHVTIGNPKKPFFSSGDMICDSVTLKFGTVLAFNDLPSTIDVKITLRPARNLGLQEIFERFNTGAGRSYIALSDSFESDSPNRYWSNWWEQTPPDPTHTANDGLGGDNSTQAQNKKAKEKGDKEYEDKKDSDKK